MAAGTGKAMAGTVGTKKVMAGSRRRQWHREGNGMAGRKDFSGKRRQGWGGKNFGWYGVWTVKNYFRNRNMNFLMIGIQIFLE